MSDESLDDSRKKKTIPCPKCEEMLEPIKELRGENVVRQPILECQKCGAKFLGLYTITDFIIQREIEDWEQFKEKHRGGSGNG